MSNIRIDIASEFKDKGFKAAEKRTTSLNRKFDKLARTAKSTFIAIAGIQALKRSVVAFAEEDRAANKLEASLRNLGLAYDTKAIEDYLEQSEKATAISKDELSPAIAGLLSTTLDAEQSMRLLNLAMDISISTGRDLTSVTTALSRAYNGNFASLGKLQTAYTAAELEAMGFEASVTALNDQFAGAAKNNADTYAGKIDKMKIAFGDLAEEIGAGIIAFLKSLGDGDYDKGLQKLVDFGTAIGNVFRRAGLTIEYTKALLATGFRIDAAEQFKLDELRAQLANPQMGEFGVNRGLLKDYAKQLELQKKIVKEREKAAKLSEKDKKNQQVLSKAQNTLDIERIQIQAALQGRITENERLRLELMRAVLNENAARAQQLQAELKQSQEDTAKLAESLTKFVANDPFTAWNNYYEAQTSDAGQLQGDLNKFLANNPFFPWEAEFGAQSDATGELNTELKTFDANDPFAFWEKHFQFQKKEKENLDKELDTFEADDPFKGWDNYFTAQNNNIEALKANLASLAALQASTTLAAASDAATSTSDTAIVSTDNAATDIIASSVSGEVFAAAVADILSTETDLASLASDLAIGGLGLEGLNLSGLDILGGLSGLGGAGMANNIVVNVAGSVTSSEDLVTFILNELYRLQNSGVAVEIL